MLAQTFAVAAMNLRSLPSRLGSSSVILVGIAGVVTVLVALLAMAGGFQAALQRGGAPDRALVLRGGANSEMVSLLSRETADIVSSLEGVLAASGELYVVADVPKRSNRQPANLVIRGLSQAAFDIRPEVRIVAGRSFRPGSKELIAGRSAASEFLGIDLGASIELRDSRWTIVGLFEANGSAYETELWADLPLVQAAYRRGGSVGSVRVQAASAEAIADLIERVRSDPRLDLEMISEAEFFRRQSEDMSRLITGFGYWVAAIMAIGALFAALNTMYTAVSARTLEIATLRALGFGAVPVVVSVMIESLALGLLGGLIGGGIAYLGFDGFTASTLNSQSFSQIAFDFAVTPARLGLGLAWAAGLGLIGGLFPAVRAACLPITRGLQGE